MMRTAIIGISSVIVLGLGMLWSGSAQAATQFDKVFTVDRSSEVTTLNQFEPAPEEQERYVALGDSVAAGIGLTGSEDDKDCGVSEAAYPALVASERGYAFQSLACSGATAGDLVTEQHLKGTDRDIEPQLDRAFADGVPALMTLTAGANDLYWQYFAQKCYDQTCGTTTDRVIIAGLRAALSAKLEYALSDIEWRADDQAPRVLVTGYYKPLAESCAQADNLTTKEVQWLNQQIDTLNATLAQTIRQYDFAEFVTVDFSGHELCTAEPWIQGMDEEAPIHPTTAGQRAIAEAVLAQL